MVLVLLVAVKPEKVHTTLFSSTPSKRERVDVLFYSYLTLMLLLCYSYVTLMLLLSGNRTYNGFKADLKRTYNKEIENKKAFISFFPHNRLVFAKKLLPLQHHKTIG
jgi:cytochrome c oxidase assembly protein Cox11